MIKQTILENIKNGSWRTLWSGMDWIHMAQDSDKWRALVNTVMNLGVKTIIGKFLSN
jgi:hypothetical protein